MVENEILANATDEIVAETDASAEPTAESTESTETARARLLLVRGNQPTDIAFEFGAPALIGRFDPEIGPIDVDLGTIDEGVYVSRRHARIDFENGAWFVEDLGSSNGTFVRRKDFERVDRAELTNGSEIAFGNARFTFEML